MLVVQKIMSPTPQTIGRDTSLFQAKQLLSELAIRHLLVIEGEKNIGIISDRDIPELGSQSELEEILVDDVMSTELFTVSADSPVVTVVERMVDQKLGSAVVMKHEKVVGIFTIIDALRLLTKLLHKQRNR